MMVNMYRQTNILRTLYLRNSDQSKFIFNMQIKETVIEYSEDSDCQRCIDLDDAVKKVDDNKYLGCGCEIKFKLKEKWEGDIYFYYGLENFYQVCISSTFNITCQGLLRLGRECMI